MKLFIILIEMRLSKDDSRRSRFKKFSKLHALLASSVFWLASLRTLYLDNLNYVSQGEIMRSKSPPLLYLSSVLAYFVRSLAQILLPSLALFARRCEVAHLASPSHPQVPSLPLFLPQACTSNRVCPYTSDFLP